MKVFNLIDMMKKICMYERKWGLYLFYMNYDPNEIQKAAPYLTIEDAFNIKNKGGIIFGNENKIEKLFWKTVGDNGSTPLNSYNGPANVYALVCSPKGVFTNENT